MKENTKIWLKKEWFKVGLFILIVIVSYSAFKLYQQNQYINESQACNQQEQVIDNNNQSAVAKAFGPSSVSMMGYQSHFNLKQSKCFVLDNYDIVLADNGVDLVTVLYDGYDNHAVANYGDELGKTDTNPICVINNVTDCTYNQFKAFVNTEMENTAY